MKIRFKSEHEDGQLFYNHCIKTEQSRQDCRPHYHDVYELLFLKEGSISYRTGEETYPLRRHALVLARPHQRHCILAEGKTPYDRYDLFSRRSCSPPVSSQKFPKI